MYINNDYPATYTVICIFCDGYLMYIKYVCRFHYAKNDIILALLNFSLTPFFSARLIILLDVLPLLLPLQPPYSLFCIVRYRVDQNNRTKYFFCNLRKVDNSNKWKNYVIVTRVQLSVKLDALVVQSIFI